VLRRALRHAGCSVLSLDHPGFGESRAPKEEDPIHAWDPLPGERAAVRLLERESPSSRLFAVGHSMGARQVLRILGAAGALRAAALFGCNLRNDSDRDEYWYGRFHSDRRLPYRLSRDRYTDVNRSFYDPDSILGSLDSGHPPVLFAFPGRDFPRNVEPSRASYDALPGPKVRWDIDGSSHYLNSEDALGLVFGDTRVTRAISKRLDRFFAREVDSLTAEGR
jgi:pimeloyl-ACP methyl ester carboxylesterase